MLFADYMRTDAARQNCNPEFYDRFISSGCVITTLNELVKFARERWPSHFPADPRKSTGMPCGRDAMQSLWASYLSWAEKVPEPRQPDPAHKG